MTKAADISLTDTTENGRHAVRVTCSCKTHGAQNGAVVLTPTLAANFPTSRIHGYVTMAHDPINIMRNKRQPQAAKVWAA